MTQFTDRERVELAEKQYQSYYAGEPVRISKDGKLVGYVSEIKDKLSGENTYIVTDIELPDNPTIEDLEKVKNVTVLYQGSSLTAQDWILNNAFMGLRISVPDFIPTRPTIQLRDAADTLKETLEKYPNANIEVYGHSLGSMNAQNAISSVDEKYDDRISGVYLYNGPNIYKTLSAEQRKNAERLHNKIFNYVDTKDMVGFGYDNRYIGQVFKINSITAPDFLKQHSWGGYLYDEDGNLIHQNGEYVSAETRIQKVDINQDGIVDFVVGSVDIRPRSLLSSDMSLVINSSAINVNPEILNTLSKNLQLRINEDISQMEKICQLCIEKNQKINKDFESRKQKVSDSIKEVFKQAGFPSLIQELNNSVDIIIQKKSLLERGMEYSELKYPFLSYQTPMVDGDLLNTTFYNTQLATLRHACEPLITQISQEKTRTILNLFMGEQTLLGSWQLIESATKHLLQKSIELFEGEGLRAGKKDGISDALTIVLEIIQKNTKELLQSLQNVIELIQGISNNFAQSYKWLGTQLKNGQFVGEIPVVSVPVNYRAYLEKDGVFDDVKDVLQAFDRQVEQKSRAYAKDVANVYVDTLGKFEHGLKQWVHHGVPLKRTVDFIKESYHNEIHVRERITSMDENGDSFTEINTYHWGQLEKLYRWDTKETIRELDTIIIPTFDRIQNAIWKSERVKNHLQHLENQLKPIVEQGVYTAFDLDEIVQGQKTVLQLARRLSQEIEYVTQGIIGEGMTAQSIDMLKHKLQDTRQLIDYYTQFVGDCFGDNENSREISTVNHNRFSLNTPMPY